MCSASCGGGSRTRTIFCTEENGNETTKVNNRGRNKDNLNISFILNSGILSVPFFCFCRGTTTSIQLPSVWRRKNRSDFIFIVFAKATRRGNLFGFSRNFNVASTGFMVRKNIYLFEDRIEASRDNDNVIENSTHFISGISFHRIESFILRAV